MTTERLTDEQITELERLERAATPGVFRAERITRKEVEIGAETPRGHMSVAWVHLGDAPTPTEIGEGLCDAICLAAARNALPSLLAEVRASRASPSARPDLVAIIDEASTLAEGIAERERGFACHSSYDPGCDGGCEETARKIGNRLSDLRAALVAAPSAREEGLRARVEALETELRETLDWFEGVGALPEDGPDAVGVYDWRDDEGALAVIDGLRRALASAPDSGSDTGAGEGGGRGE